MNIKQFKVSSLPLGMLYNVYTYHVYQILINNYLTTRHVVQCIYVLYNVYQIISMYLRLTKTPFLSAR